MGFKTTLKVWGYMVWDIIRHPLTASTIHISGTGKVYVVRAAGKDIVGKR